MAARWCCKSLVEKVYPEERLDGKKCIRCCFCWDCLSGPAPERVRPFTNDTTAPLLPETSKSLVGLLDKCIACGQRSSEDVEFMRRRRQVCLGAYVALSVLLLTICYYLQNFAAATALGAPRSFGSSSSLLKYSHAFGESRCGPLGNECKPFDAWVPIRCDGWISKDTEENTFGSGPYRADSAVCKAARHSGVIGDMGGCVDMRIGGPACEFRGSFRNGIRTQPFDSWFPVTLELRPSRGASLCGWDGWWALMLVNVALLWGLTFLRPSRRLWFWSLVISLYWYAALGSNAGHQTAEDLLIRGGSCGLLVLCCHWVLWEIGGAKHFLPDFAAGAPFDGLMEVLLPLPLLHQHLLKWLTGDHDLNKKTFSSVEGPLFFGVVVLILLPIVIWMVRRWWYSGVLRGLSCAFLAVGLAVAMLSVLFATSNFSFHLHHYFLGLLGCLFFRGNSRIAAVMRAICLGSFVNGVAFWGFGKHLPLWSHDASGDATGLTPWRKSSLPNYTALRDPEGKPALTQIMMGSDDNTMLTLSWTYMSSRDNELTWQDWCERLDREMSNRGYGPDRAWVLEMNNIEIYRGRGHTVSYNISELTVPCDPGRFYLVLGTVDTGPWGIPHYPLRRFIINTSNLDEHDGHANVCRQGYFGRNTSNTSSLNASNESSLNASNESMLNASDGDANSSVLNASTLNASGGDANSSVLNASI